MHPGLLLITCKRGVKKGGSRVPTSGLHAINACWFLFLLSAYLVVAGAASFDKKSHAGAIQRDTVALNLNGAYDLLFTFEKLYYSMLLLVFLQSLIT